MSVTPGSINPHKPISVTAGASDIRNGQPNNAMKAQTPLSNYSSAIGRPSSIQSSNAKQTAPVVSVNRTSSGNVSVPPLSTAKRSIYGTASPSAGISQSSSTSNLHQPAPISSTPNTMAPRKTIYDKSSPSSHTTTALHTPGPAKMSTPGTHSTPANLATDRIASVAAIAKTPIQVPKPSSNHLMSDAQWAEMNLSEAVNFSDFSLLAPTGSVASSGAVQASTSSSGGSFGLPSPSVPPVAPATSSSKPNAQSTASFPSLFDIVDATSSNSPRTHVQPSQTISTSTTATAKPTASSSVYQKRTLSPSSIAVAPKPNPTIAPSKTSSGSIVVSSKHTSNPITSSQLPNQGVDMGPKRTSSPTVVSSPITFSDEMDVDYEALYLAAVAEADKSRKKAESERKALEQVVAEQEKAMQLMKQEEAKIKKEASDLAARQRLELDKQKQSLMQPSASSSTTIANAESSNDRASVQLKEQLEQAKMELERKTRDIDRLKSQLVSAHMEGISDDLSTSTANSPQNPKKRNHAAISPTSFASPAAAVTPTPTSSTPQPLPQSTIKARKVQEERSAKKRKLVENFPFLDTTGDLDPLISQDTSFALHEADLLLEIDTLAEERASWLGSLSHLDSDSLSLSGGLKALQLVAQMLLNPQGPLIWLQSHQTSFAVTESIQASFNALQSTVSAFNTKKEALVVKIQRPSLLAEEALPDKTFSPERPTPGSPYGRFGTSSSQGESKADGGVRRAQEEQDRLLVSAYIFQIFQAVYLLVQRLLEHYNQRESMLMDAFDPSDAAPSSAPGSVGNSHFPSRFPEPTPSLPSTANLSSNHLGSTGLQNAQTSRTSAITLSNATISQASQLRQFPSKAASSSAIPTTTAPTQGGTATQPNSKQNSAASAPAFGISTKSQISITLSDQERDVLTHCFWLLGALLSSDPISRALALLPLRANTPQSTNSERKLASPASSRSSKVIQTLKELVLSTHAHLIASPSSSSHLLSTTILHFLSYYIDPLVFARSFSPQESLASSPASTGAPLPINAHVSSMAYSGNQGSSMHLSHGNNSTNALSSTALPVATHAPSASMLPNTAVPASTGTMGGFAREVTKLLPISEVSLSSLSSSSLILLESIISLFNIVTSDSEALMYPSELKPEKIPTSAHSPVFVLKSILMQVHSHGSSTAALYPLVESYKEAYQAISTFLACDAVSQALSPYPKASSSSSASALPHSFVLPQIVALSWTAVQRIVNQLGNSSDLFIDLEQLIGHAKQLLMTSPTANYTAAATNLERRRTEWLLGNASVSHFSYTLLNPQQSLTGIMDLQSLHMTTKLSMIRCIQAYANRKREAFHKILSNVSGHSGSTSNSNQSKPNNEPNSHDRGAMIDLGSQLATTLVIGVSITSENMVRSLLLHDSLDYICASHPNGGSNLKFDYWNHPLPILGPAAPSSSVHADHYQTLASAFNMKTSEDAFTCIEDSDATIFGKTALTSLSQTPPIAHKSQLSLLIHTLNFIQESCDMVLLIMRNLPKCAHILRSSEPELWSSYRTLDSLEKIMSQFTSRISPDQNKESASFYEVASAASTFSDFANLRISECVCRLNSILENLATLQAQH